MELIHKPNLAKYTFLYLLSLVTLIMTAMAVGNVLFELINKFIADPLANYGDIYNPSSIKFGIATLIIASPIYFYSTWLILKNLTTGKLDVEATPRRWLTYLIILISAFVMLGWLIGVLFGFLDGDLTTRFILKGVVSLLLAGSIFGFYFYDVRRQKAIKGDQIIRGSAIAAVVVVLASLIASFFFVESPTLARNKRHDQSLLNNFEQIRYSVESYFTEYKKLPPDLQVLITEKRGISDAFTKDPITGETIEYILVAPKKYQLCANFATSNIGADPKLDNLVTSWPHGAGRQCLTQQVFSMGENQTITKPASVETEPIK